MCWNEIPFKGYLILLFSLALLILLLKILSYRQSIAYLFILNMAKVKYIIKLHHYPFQVLHLNNTWIENKKQN